MTDKKNLNGMLNELDDEELLLKEVFLAGKSSGEGSQSKESGKDDALATGIFLNEEVVFDEGEVKAREEFLNRLQGRAIKVIYQWFLWDSSDISEANSWEDCRVFIEDQCMLLYDAEGELKFRLPLNRIMFKARENMISIAWFDQEMDTIYYALELHAELF